MPGRLLGLTPMIALVAVLAAAAHADVVTFKDGTKLEGTVVEERADDLVVIGYNRGGREHKYTVLVPNPRQWE